jgi:hypothetical protein
MAKNYLSREAIILIDANRRRTSQAAVTGKQTYPCEFRVYSVKSWFSVCGNSELMEVSSMETLARDGVYL